MLLDHDFMVKRRMTFCGKIHRCFIDKDEYAEFSSLCNNESPTIISDSPGSGVSVSTFV